MSWGRNWSAWSFTTHVPGAVWNWLAGGSGLLVALVWGAVAMAEGLPAVSGNVLVGSRPWLMGGWMTGVCGGSG